MLSLRTAAKNCPSGENFMYPTLMGCAAKAKMSGPALMSCGVPNPAEVISITNKVPGKVLVYKVVGQPIGASVGVLGNGQALTGRCGGYDGGGCRNGPCADVNFTDPYPIGAVPYIGGGDVIDVIVARPWNNGGRLGTGRVAAQRV